MAAPPLNRVVLAGGTGPVGQFLARSMAATVSKEVVILCRNSYLARTPNRVSGDYGWVGKRLAAQEGVVLRDWDGGDMSDIVGQDWLGWEEVLDGADVVINLVGTFTYQRGKATERLVRATVDLPTERQPLLLDVAPLVPVLSSLGPTGMTTLKTAELKECDSWIQALADAGSKGFSVRVGFLLGLPTPGPPPQADRLANQPWLHVDDLLAAITAISLQRGATDRVTGDTVDLAVGKPLEGVNYQWTNLDAAVEDVKMRMRNAQI